MSMTRRADVTQYTEAELKIRDAMLAVEVLPGDVRLTDAVNLLHCAREAVADYVDGMKHYRRFVDHQPFGE